MVNSTGLAERIGAEALHEMLRRFIDTGIAEVRRYDGAVPQFTGDGFMALFGAPVAHEDHVRRALLAAMAILRAVGGRAEQGAAKEPAGVAIRIGIHTGLVVFGAVADDLRMDSTAVGGTANIAARLQEAAEPGSIVLSEVTLQLARGYARAEPIGALRLKGKMEPVSAFRLIEMSSQTRDDVEEQSSAEQTSQKPRLGSRLLRIVSLLKPSHSSSSFNPAESTSAGSPMKYPEDPPFPSWEERQHAIAQWKEQVGDKLLAPSLEVLKKAPPFHKGGIIARLRNVSRKSKRIDPRVVAGALGAEVITKKRDQ